MKSLKRLTLSLSLLCLLLACQPRHSGWMYGRWQTDLETTQRANPDLRNALTEADAGRVFKSLEDSPPLELTQQEVIIGAENPSHFSYQTLKATEEAFHAQMPGNVSFILHKDQNGVYRENTGYISVAGKSEAYTVKQYLKAMAIPPIPAPVH